MLIHRGIGDSEEASWNMTIDTCNCCNGSSMGPTPNLCGTTDLLVILENASESIGGSSSVDRPQRYLVVPPW